ncbi:MAG: hypothetical protein EOO45_07760 [Flavobacterium sp.]|nr:MAG: hypothetical protein EOO45_07760 [Flavobacterium sp.]
MKLNRLFAMLALTGLFISCTSDDSSTPDVPKGSFDNGVLVLNEGGFNFGNASVSFLSNDFMLENNIFSRVNSGAVLGDTGQDIGLNGELAYIVVNNSHKIEVVNRYSFVKVATITTGLDNPRYIAFYNNKAFVTNWGSGEVATDDFVAVIDLSTNTVTSSIPVAEGPEKIIEENGKLYIAHSGGFGYGSTVTVLNASNNSFITSIPVGDVPNSLDVEDDKLYVLSGGKPAFAGSETAGSLHVINLTNNNVTATHNFALGQHPSHLTIEDDAVYYVEDKSVYKMSMSATVLPEQPLFTTQANGAYSIYSFAIEDSRIYLGNAGNYNSNGTMQVFSLTGQLLNTSTVGVIPTGFYFND